MHHPQYGVRRAPPNSIQGGEGRLHAAFPDAWRY
jgi:hypothetical protein